MSSKNMSMFMIIIKWKKKMGISKPDSPINSFLIRHLSVISRVEQMMALIRVSTVDLWGTVSAIFSSLMIKLNLWYKWFSFCKMDRKICHDYKLLPLCKMERKMLWLKRFSSCKMGDGWILHRATWVTVYFG